jgi:hypothetical protein
MTCFYKELKLTNLNLQYSFFLNQKIYNCLILMLKYIYYFYKFIEHQK